ncbi:C-type lectin domain family 4 member F [Tupaia chinensis]|uniref:C-type lectin domain family 4 member F n=1 Tax=Tupaia chinensis TaxID=246437 RepID=UPI0003C900BA|nr:C-type lectin domain family 4 member F [Tupaia chinensis]
MRDSETDGDTVHFCSDSQRVSLHPQGMGSTAVAPAAPRKHRLIKAALALAAMSVVSCLVALFIVVLQSPGPVLEADPSFQEFRDVVLGDNSTRQLPVEPNYHHHLGKVAEVREAIRMFKDHVENSSSWHVEIQMLKCRVDNVSSQIQMLSDHLGNTSVDIQSVKGALQNTKNSSLQTQMLRGSLEGANTEIQRLKGSLEKAKALTSQTQSLLIASSENTSIELHMLSRGLESANTEIQILKEGLELANAQAGLANSSLKNANAEISILRAHLDSISDLKTQNQVLRSGLEGANEAVQRLEGSVQTANALNSQTQAFLNSSLENTSAEIRLLRSHLERAGNETHLLKRGLETVTTQTQTANNRLDQTDAQIQVLKTELENAKTLHSQVQVLDDYFKNASKEIQTLKQGMTDAAALNSQTRMLESSLQKADAEIQRLKEDLENTKTLTAKIQEELSHLEGLQATVTAQEQQQRTQNHLLQLILQGWKVNQGNLYYFSHVKKTWNEAERFCVSLGAHLASVTSKEEQAFLIKFTSDLYHWIGLTDRGTEGSWRWTDGTPYNQAQSRQFWEKNQPDNWRHSNGQTEDCVHTQEKWNDIECGSSLHWVCKKPMGQDVA